MLATLKKSQWLCLPSLANATQGGVDGFGGSISDGGAKGLSWL
jgi:hypothetical protein